MLVHAPVPSKFKTPDITQDLQLHLAEVTGLFNRFYANLGSTIGCADADLTQIESFLASALAKAHTLVVGKAMDGGLGQKGQEPSLPSPILEEALVSPTQWQYEGSGQYQVPAGLPSHPYNRAFEALLVHTESEPSTARETLRAFWQGLFPAKLGEQAWREFRLDDASAEIAEDLLSCLNKPAHHWPRFRLHDVITDGDFEEDPVMGTRVPNPTWVQVISTAEAVRQGYLKPLHLVELIRSRMREHCDRELHQQLLTQNAALRDSFDPTIPAPSVGVSPMH